MSRNSCTTSNLQDDIDISRRFSSQNPLDVSLIQSNGVMRNSPRQLDQQSRSIKVNQLPSMVIQDVPTFRSNTAEIENLSACEPVWFHCRSVLYFPYLFCGSKESQDPLWDSAKIRKQALTLTSTLSWPNRHLPHGCQSTPRSSHYQ